MRPLLLKGHERPLTYIKYNHEGDVFVSCAKDKHPTLWFSDTGERIGTYLGHEGATWSCDITRDSKYLYTASADCSVRKWELATGTEVHQWKYSVPCRSTDLSLGEEFLLITTDTFMRKASAVRVIKLGDPGTAEEDEVLNIEGAHGGRITRAIWGPLNKTIITVGEDGKARKFDVETQKLLQEEDIHEMKINCLSLDADRTHFLTVSTDKQAKIFDIDTLKCLKTYKADRPLNGGDMSPLLEHVCVGGGQDAAAVTTTAGQAGKFEACFFHKIYEEEFGNVKGHFGPINVIAFHPNGKSFTTGGEDGYVRIHHMDNEYFTEKYV